MGLGTIYLVCAIAGGTLLVLRIAMLAIGLDHGGDLADGGGQLDLNHDGVLDDLADGQAGHGGISFLSLQSIAGFFTMFGLVGMGLLQIKASEVLSLVGALAAGAFTAWCSGMIFLFMRRLQSDGTLELQNAVGQFGAVYLTVPTEGTGVVNVTVQGALRTLDAVSSNGQAIPTGRIVKVLAITGGKILVVAEETAEIQLQDAGVKSHV